MSKTVLTVKHPETGEEHTYRQIGKLTSVNSNVAYTRHKTYGWTLRELFGLDIRVRPAKKKHNNYHNRMDEKVVKKVVQHFKYDPAEERRQRARDIALRDYGIVV